MSAAASPFHVKKHPAPPKLETERLCLHHLHTAYIPAIAAGYAEAAGILPRWFPWAQSTLDEASARTFVEESAKKENHHEFCLFLKKTGAWCGTFGIFIKNEKVPTYEIGYWLRPSLHGRALAAEAVGALTRFGFGELGANRLQIRMRPENIPSKRTAEKAGFHYEGCLKNEDTNPQTGEPCDSLYYGLTRQQYEEKAE